MSDGTTIDPNDTDPTWVSGRGTNNDFLVAYTRSTRPTLFAKLTVAGANSTYQTASVRVKEGGTVLATVTNVNVASNGSVPINSIPFTADLSDASLVKQSMYTFTWEISFNGSSWNPIGNSGTHEVHWLYGAPMQPTFQNPESVLTNPNRTYEGLFDVALRHATAKTGNGTTDIDAIASAITTGVTADLVYDPGRQSPDRNPLFIYTDPNKGLQCSDNVALLRGLLRSIGVPNITNYFWGGNPSSQTEFSHWFNIPGTGAYITSQYPRPALNEGGVIVAANPYFTFHSTLRVGPMNTSYDPSYGIVENEVSLIRAVDSLGTCLNGPAANAARIISTNLLNLFTAGNRQYFTDPCTTTVPPHAAAVVGQSVPAFMDAGQSYLVSVTMQNNGSSTWTQAEGYKLGSQNPQDNMIWGFNRVELPASVSPNGQVTFNFYVTAPSIGGTYNFQWRMVKEYVEWFGDYTPNVVIDVFADPTCSAYLEQQCLQNGGEWDPTTCRCYGVDCGIGRICPPQY